MAIAMLNQLVALQKVMPMDPRQISMLRFKFEDFIRKCCSSSPAATPFFADSAAIDEGGNNWRLHLRKGIPQQVPSKKKKQGKHRVMISLVLVKEGIRLNNDETTKFSFIMRDVHGNVVHEEAFLSTQCDNEDSSCTGFMKSFTMKGFKVDDHILANGALTIDVALQVIAKTKPDQPQCSNPFGENMLKILYSGERADVAFEVGDAIIRAHKLVLEVNAPALARLCDGRIDTLNKPITIPKTSPEAFRYVLQYIYGGEAPGTRDIIRLGKDLIVTAYRFGAMGLKMKVEHALVENCVVDVSNCIDYIFFANKHDCIVLTNHAMSYLVARSHDVLSSESSDKLKQRPELMHEIMYEMAGKSEGDEDSKQKQKILRGRRKSLDGWDKKSKHEASPWAQERLGPNTRKVLGPASPSSAIPEFDADEVRSEAMRILQAVDGKQRPRRKSQRKKSIQKVMQEKIIPQQLALNRLQSPTSHYMRMHGNHGWIVAS